MSSQTPVIIASLSPKDKQARTEVGAPKKKKKKIGKRDGPHECMRINALAALDIITKRKRERLEE